MRVGLPGARIAAPHAANPGDARDIGREWLHDGGTGKRALGSLGAGRQQPRGPASTGVGESRSNDLLLILAFSGGGTRAAAFAYGVLEELAATPVILGGRPRRLLDEVDLISVVSGGSFTAACYGLYGDRVFHDFETEFLKRPVEQRLIVQLLRPRNWVRLASLPSTAASSRRSTTRSISSGARRSPIWSSEAAPRS